MFMQKKQVIDNFFTLGKKFSFILFAFTCMASMPRAVLANVIQDENNKVGTTAWDIAPGDFARTNEIEGYASATSVAPGETIDLFVNTADPTYSISVYRLGWYNGLGGRLVNITDPITHSPVSAVQLDRQDQPLPTTDPTTFLVECNWKTSYTLAIDSSFTSGVYFAKLTGASGKQNEIMFVVRNDQSTSDFLFQSAVTTFAAYNGWGGYSLYGSDIPGQGPASKVSFNRPYTDGGSSLFLRWEYEMVRFMEREGFDVSYSTSLDTHNLNSSNTIQNHRAFLSVGHDEYWTKEIYDNVENARNQGVNLGFFGPNTGYWQIRMEPSSLGQANRTVVGYKYNVDNDPLNGTPLATTTWRNLNRPEAALVGVMYAYDTYIGDIVIKSCPGWLCAGNLSIKPGDTLKGVLGYEQDSLDASSPAGIITIGASPYLNSSFNPPQTVCCANMTYYTASSGAGVFASGSMYWNWGLDNYWTTIDPTTTAKVQQITRNVLQQFTQRNPAAPTNILPSITVTQPTSTIVALGSTINLAATAIDTDGLISKVEFYDGTSLIGTATQAGSTSFTLQWSNAVKGTHVVTAKAYDDLGASTISSSVTITVKDPTLRQTQIVGSDRATGTKFKDTVAIDQVLTGVTVRAGWWIDAIQGVTNTGDLPTHGGNGGLAYTISWPADEYLVRVFGRMGQSFTNHIGQINFVTNTGRVIGPFGLGLGSNDRVNFDLKVPPGNEVVGFSGKSDIYLNAIGLVYRAR